MRDADPRKRPDVSQRAETSGDGNYIGEITQIGQVNNHYGHQDPTKPTPLNYRAKWSWKSPLTQARLAWIGVILALIPLVSALKAYKPFVDGSAPRDLGSQSNDQLIWVLLLVVGAATVGLIIALRNIVRHRRHSFAPSSLLPVLSEADGHLAVARYEGTCPECDGKLRFYNKAVAWNTVPTSNGGHKKKVAKRAMVAECVRDPDDHCWKLGATDTIL